jgi:predicted GNAT superfamily acetyltransferase
VTPSSSADPAGFRILSLKTGAHWRQAAELYRSVFGYDHPSYGLNPRLLAGLAGNGGSVVGALDADDQLVGFAYGFLGSDGRQTYHYSQAAVVAAGLQGKGLGRRLKLAQRQEALNWGSTSMRWAYDPLLTRNAHFNLDVLGAQGVRFLPEMYDEPGTDRILVAWDLTVEPGTHPVPELPDLAGATWGEMIKEADGGSDRLLLPLPSNIAAIRASEPDSAADLAGRVREILIKVFDRGYRAVSCGLQGDTACYVFRSPTE